MRTMNKIVIKTKKAPPKTYYYAWGCRKIAEKRWGNLKVADSFLYLYRRFGTPCADTNDEYKISYEYNFLYKGLYFIVCATTPEYVYLDCYMPKKYFVLQRNRYRKDVRLIFERAAKDSILTYPWASYNDVMDSLTKKQQEHAMKMFTNELVTVIGEENNKFMEGVTDDSPEEDKKKVYDLYVQLWKHLADKFWKWARNDESIETLFNGDLDLRYLPEVKIIIEQFCKEMLKTKSIRDCDINIKGWQ